MGLRVERGMTKPIVVDRIRLDEDASAAILRCRLVTDGLDLPPEIWYRFPPELAATLAVNGDAFLPVAMMAGMRRQRDVVIDGDVSAALLGSSRRIMRVMQRWSDQADDGLVTIRVDAHRKERTRDGITAGAFFSGGVDSFHTVLKNLRRYAPGDPRMITHLILVHGFDIPLDQTELFAQAHRHARDAADAFGQQLVPVRTNARHVLDGLDWGRYAHGAGLAGVGLALGGLFHTVFIAAGHHFFDLIPWASHPAVDPHWSTEGLEFVHDGAEYRRAEKVEVIATSPAALAALRVCWENPGGAYNCGTCEKCLRTMVDLQLCGALERSERFPNAVDLDAVERLTLTANVRAMWSQALHQLRATGGDPQLIASIERALRRGARTDSTLGRVLTNWRRYLR
jgi:hypothetical protein